MKDTLIPVLLGADLNAYGMARAFFEAYGVPSVAFGRQSLGATRHLRYLSAHVIPDLADPAVCRGILLDFAKENPKKTLLLLACTDAYVRFLAENASILSPPYILSAPPKAALALTEKDVFCRLCAERGIPCPETEVFRGIPSAAELTAAGYVFTSETDTEAAAKLLSDGYSVGESARLCGYRDQFNFSKMFRRRYGVSPKEYAYKSKE